MVGELAGIIVNLSGFLDFISPLISIIHLGGLGQDHRKGGYLFDSLINLNFYILRISLGIFSNLS